METHNRASGGSEGLSYGKRTLEVAHFFLTSNRNNAVIRCVCHHVSVTSVKLSCMEFFEATVVLSSSHLLREGTQKYAGKEACKQRLLQKVSWKRKPNTHHTNPHMCQVSKRIDIHTGRHPVVPKSTETHRFRTIHIAFKNKTCMVLE